MRLSIVERQLLWNQLEILKAQQPDQAADYARQQTILAGGYSGQYSEVVHLMETGDGMPEADQRLVMDVLDLYRALHRYRQHGGKVRFPFDTFQGFDGNNEGDLCGYARFLVDDQGRWKELSITAFNSRMPTRVTYRRLLDAWRLEHGVGSHILVDADVQAIANAVTHPDHR
ncbi:MAG: YfbU family protein [Gemmatimonadaceae bacterium]|nr:YfbU family protein [Acetobacteraceae bacterium]